MNTCSAATMRSQVQSGFNWKCWSWEQLPALYPLPVRHSRNEIPKREERLHNGLEWCGNVRVHVQLDIIADLHELKCSIRTSLFKFRQEGMCIHVPGADKGEEWAEKSSVAIDYQQINKTYFKSRPDANFITGKFRDDLLPDKNGNHDECEI